MKSDTSKRIKEIIFAAVAAGTLMILAHLGLYRCPLDYVLGIPCPTCGITRALLSVLNGDLKAAFYYHPLWPVFLLSALLGGLYHINIIHASRKVFRTSCFIVAALIAVCFIIRHITHSPIVAIHFKSSALYRLLPSVAFFP